MSRQFIDDDLVQWEVFPSTGLFSLPDDGRLVFLCQSDRERRPRQITTDRDVVDASALLEEVPDSQLRELLSRSREIP